MPSILIASGLPIKVFLAAEMDSLLGLHNRGLRAQARLSSLASSLTEVDRDLQHQFVAVPEK